jgi:hypothetical protein
MKRAVNLFGFGVAACIAAGPALAHHSFSMFDFSKTATHQVEVVAFEWSNPHAWLHVLLPEADGKSYEWALEMGSIAQITAGGWTPESVKAGDKISVTMAPLRDGSRGGSFRSGVLADGRKVSNFGGREAP